MPPVERKRRVFTTGPAGKSSEITLFKALAQDLTVDLKILLLISLRLTFSSNLYHILLPASQQPLARLLKTQNWTIQ